ncbi:MAG: alpha/beta hydrolase [Candidatus Zixiibacteriota bacterium]
MFRFRDLDLNYQTYGNGPTALLFIHGLGGNGNSWKYQIDCFTKDYEIVTIDLFGHGQSSKNIDPILAPRLDAEAAVGLVHEIVKKPYFIIGHSFATNIIPEIMKMEQMLLKGAAFVDCTFQGFDDIIESRIALAERMLALSGEALQIETAIWYDSIIGPRVSAEDREFIHSSLKKCRIRWLFESVAGCRDYCSKYPPRETPVRDDFPIFIMEADNGIGGDIRKSWVNHFKHARYFLFDNAWHFFFVTERDRFNGLLSDFLKKNASN